MNPNGPFEIVLFSALAITMVALFIRHRNQQMLHQERMAAIEKGVAVPVGRTLPLWSPRAYLLRGLIWSMSGAALSVFLFFLAASTHPPSLESVLSDASVKVFSEEAKIPLDDARMILARRDRDRGIPSAVALLGLIPLCIGFAYLAFYYTDDSRHQDSAGSPSTSHP